MTLDVSLDVLMYTHLHQLAAGILGTHCLILAANTVDKDVAHSTHACGNVRFAVAAVKFQLTSLEILKTQDWWSQTLRR